MTYNQVDVLMVLSIVLYSSMLFVFVLPSTAMHTHSHSHTHTHTHTVERVGGGPSMPCCGTS